MPIKRVQSAKLCTEYSNHAVMRSISRKRGKEKGSRGLMNGLYVSRTINLHNDRGEREKEKKARVCGPWIPLPTILCV